MFKYCFICVILAWASRDVLANKTENPLLIDQVAINQQQWFTFIALKESEMQQKIVRIERSIEERLMAMQSKLAYALNELQTIMGNQSVETLEKLRISHRINPALFQRMGTRRFYIEKENKQNWFGASNTCRQLGGHIATIKDEQEFNEIFSRAPAGVFWIDMNAMFKNGLFASSLTGRSPPFFKWKKEERGNKFDCVNVYNKEMYNENCFNTHLFICQAEQWD